MSDGVENFDLTKKAYAELKNMEAMIADIEGMIGFKNRDYAVLIDNDDKILPILEKYGVITIEANTVINLQQRTNIKYVNIYKTDKFDEFTAEMNCAIHAKKQDRDSCIAVNVDIDDVVRQIILFMKEEVEMMGLFVGQVYFDFSEDYVLGYPGNHPSKYIEEGEDSVKFKSTVANYSSELMRKATNVAKSMGLISQSKWHPSKNSSLCDCEKSLFLQMTDSGYHNAIHYANQMKFEKVSEELSDVCDNSVLWLTYSKECKILLNDIILIHSCQHNSMNDRIMRFLTNPENDSKTFNREDLFEAGILKNKVSKNDSIRSQFKETKSLFSFLDDICIKGDLRKAFFPVVSTNVIQFRNNITQSILDRLNIAYIDAKNEFGSNSTRKP